MVRWAPGQVMFRRFIMDQTGATALEYGLLVALLIAMWVFGLSMSGQGMADVYNFVGETIENARTH